MTEQWFYSENNFNNNNNNNIIQNIQNSSKDDCEHNIDVTQMYLHDIGFESLLTPLEEIEFATKAQEGDLSSRHRMINGNLRLVVKIARGYLHRGILLSDLIEEGNIGLMKAVDKFDPTRGFRFSTYATWWIRQSIERAIMNQSRTVRLPIHVLKKMTGCLKTIKKLSNNCDHTPTIKEVSDVLDKPIEDIQSILMLTDGSLSIDSPIDESGHPLVDAIPDINSQDPSLILQDQTLHKHIETWISALPYKHKEVVIRRFGLLGHEIETLEKVGEEIELTRERVRQIQVEALKKLRNILKESGLSSFFEM